MGTDKLREVPLGALHKKLGARMTGFAGYELPLQYAGIIAEHNHTRTACSLFDVSHMCQFTLAGSDRVANADRLLPLAASKLGNARNKYTFMCNESGGVIDDMIFGNDGDSFFCVCNASRADAVLSHISERLDGDCKLERLGDRALLALQGPQAAAVLSSVTEGIGDLYFMDSAWLTIAGVKVRICRCGYTGEDGFEISVPAESAAGLAQQLLADDRVLPAGLGARDSLRLEAGLCLYGNELDESITPIEAGLVWAISPSRRREGGFIGSEPILAQIAAGSQRMLAGIAVGGRSALRSGAQLMAADGSAAGTVTSGCWSPSLKRPIAIALLEAKHAAAGCKLDGLLRGSKVECETVSLPHVAHQYRIRKRKATSA